MIENIPNPKDFLHTSAEFLYEAFNIFIPFIDEHDPLILFSGDNGFDEDEFIEENKIKIGNMSLLIFSSIENYLKYKIALESPLLLIEKLSNLQWKKMKFNDFYMHGFEDLLKLYSVIYATTENSILKTGFEDLRKTRNMFVHGSGEECLTLEKLVKVSCFFIQEIWNKSAPKEKGHDFIFKYFSDFSGALDYYDNTLEFMPEIEENNNQHEKLLKIYRFLGCFLTKNELLAFLGLNKTEMITECPACSMYSFIFNASKNESAKIYKDNDGEDILKCYLCQLETKIVE
ncbi:MAG: hypothetical protein PHW70_07350 [Acinetobacter towneri]|uniref:hypothetical protein n=1 Tax=Acinetobacter towneri TaxID=202956 RepID=UPI001F61689F|nr:hypothetical protein [Acinetobacter towneri]MDD4852953.1 hypothetical protein [Acinetobacter towneri]UNT65668.1 hypothetical protein IHE37_06340 [Acinetobacter towneri]